MIVAGANWRAILIALVLLIGATSLLAPTAARAQVLGTWGTAVPYAPDEIAIGAFLLVGEPIGLVGQFRTGVGDNWDIGVQAGFPDFDAPGENTLYGITGDLKYLILPESVDFPLDMSVDVAFGYQHAGGDGVGVDIVDFDFGAVVSKEMQTSGGKTLTPYGSVMFAIANFDVDFEPPEGVPPGLIDDPGSDTEFDINVRGGIEYPLRPDLDFLAELNLSSRDETLAISFGLMKGL
jgi:hypothetical protein